jgi:hypothetical protein
MVSDEPTPEAAKEASRIRFQPPKVAGHRFVDTSEGWACEVCQRRWADVIARQPSWPAHDRANGAPMSEGIACVGTLNTPEEEQIEAEKARIWDTIREAVA